MSNANRPKPIVPDSATFGKHLSFMGARQAFCAGGWQESPNVYHKSRAGLTVGGGWNPVGHARAGAIHQTRTLQLRRCNVVCPTCEVGSFPLGRARFLSDHPI